MSIRNWRLADVRLFCGFGKPSRCSEPIIKRKFIWPAQFSLPAFFLNRIDTTSQNGMALSIVCPNCANTMLYLPSAWLVVVETASSFRVPFEYSRISASTSESSSHDRNIGYQLSGNASDDDEGSPTGSPNIACAHVMPPGTQLPTRLGAEMLIVSGSACASKRTRGMRPTADMMRL